jgi:hypothetical protein
MNHSIFPRQLSLLTLQTIQLRSSQLIHIALSKNSPINKSNRTLRPILQNPATMSKLLTVFGATGNQGGSVIKAVLADPVLSKEFKIRGITRDTSKPSAQALAAQGVEVVAVRLPPFSISRFHASVPSLTMTAGRHVF